MTFGPKDSNVWVRLLETIDVISNCQTTGDAAASCFPGPERSLGNVSRPDYQGCRCLVFLRL
eukprot:5506146-Amphidinium_carterae.1